jgi:prolipoprotein diacylglyceryltransferase
MESMRINMPLDGIYTINWKHTAFVLPYFFRNYTVYHFETTYNHLRHPINIYESNFPVIVLFDNCQ